MPSIEWQRVFGGWENDSLYSIHQTADGGFVLGGTTISPAGGNKTATNNGYTDYWVVRLDAQGNHLWDRTYGGTGYESLGCVRETTDGGFIVGGFTCSSVGGTKITPFWGGYNDYWVIRVDGRGNELWQGDFGGTGADDLKSVLPTQDGGFLAAGSSGSLPSGNKTTTPFGYPDYWIVRLDADGNKLWEGTYGGIYGEKLWTAEQTRDGGFILAGGSDSPASGNKSSPNYGTTNYLKWTPDFWIVRLDLNGNKLWDRSYGGTNDDTIYAIVEFPDGGFAFGGRSDSPPGGNKTSPNYGEYDYWLIRTDANGNKLWEQTFGGTNGDMLYSLDVTTDGGLILGGMSYSEVSGNKTAPNRGSGDYWFIRLDADGKKVWEEAFGGSRSEGMERAHCVQQTRDGGYILGGTSYSPADGNKTVDRWAAPWCDFWIIKLAPEQPVLRLLPSEGRADMRRLTLDGIKNLTYAVDYTSDFKGWKPVATNQMTSSTAEIVDPGASKAAQRFYRARRVP